jgi:SanA protein
MATFYHRHRRKLRVLAGVLLGGAAAMMVCDGIVRRAGVPTYDTVAQAPKNRVGLVLGCGRFVSASRENLFFTNRIEAAWRLFEAGKVEYLLVSGDNHVAGYDEPTDMKLALVALGVPAERIVCDYAGFTTLDSIVRAKEVFGQAAVTIISQKFHNERAIYLARTHGLEAVGFNAEDVGLRRGLKTYVREAASRVKAVWDVNVWRRQPKFLGEPVRIGTATGAGA